MFVRAVCARRAQLVAGGRSAGGAAVPRAAAARMARANAGEMRLTATGPRRSSRCMHCCATSSVRTFTFALRTSRCCSGQFGRCDPGARHMRCSCSAAGETRAVMSRSTRMLRALMEKEGARDDPHTFVITALQLCTSRSRCTLRRRPTWRARICKRAMSCCSFRGSTPARSRWV